MAKLNLGIDVRDFDLDRLGFSLAVLDETKKRQVSDSYLRMTLPELNAFLKALKSARDDIEVTTFEPTGVARFGNGKTSRRENNDSAPLVTEKFLAAE